MASAPTRQNDRLHQIGRMLIQRGRLPLREAAHTLGVSEMTIRRDVAASQGRFLSLGGFLLAGDGPDEPGYSMDREKDSHTQAKHAACRKAAALIEPGDTLFIDCGTTTPHLAASLPIDHNLTVICYAMNIADILCRRPDLRVIVLGGLYHMSSASFSGDDAVAMLEKIGINKAFISAGGVHPERGISCSNFHEVAIKRAAIQASVRKYIVVNADKIGTIKPAFFAALDEFDAIITDASISRVQEKSLADRQIPVEIAP